MQIYKAVVIMFLCEIGIVLSNGEEWQLPLSIEEEFNQELYHPNELNTNQVRLISESNNLSTDGYEVYPGQFPYHAIVNIKNDREASTTVTSGSLITPNYILTCALGLHKHENTYGFVELGYRYRADRERQQVIDFTRSGINIHPQFTGGLLNNIATIRLEHPVTLNRYVQPIRLPRLSDTRTFEMMEGTSLGLEYNGTMRYLRNQIMSTNDCHTNTQIICTNAYIGGAFCNRMYGAGLVVEDESGPILIGVTSSISWCSVNNPIWYMRLSHFRDWIENSSNYVFDF